MKRSLNPKDLNKFDKSGMLNLLLNFPEQCRVAQQIAEDAGIAFEGRSFKSIVFCGLGGSAIGADLVRSYLYFESKAPIQVLREYRLPAYVDNSTLVFISSYSGNTEETLSAYAEAKSKGATIVAVSSGGSLKQSAQKDNFTFIEIPASLPPRCALGYLSIVPLCVLSRLGLIKDQRQPVEQMIVLLESLRERNVGPGVAQKDNIAKAVAAKLLNKFPVIYSASTHFDVCVTRLRGQLSENSKSLASGHVFPEMNHNEIVGWQNPKKLFKDFVVLMLRDKGMHPRVAKRMDITGDILKKEGINVIEIWSQGPDLLSRIFSLIYIGDFISYYLAILYGIDPTPVERVTFLKNQLAGK